MKIGFVLDDTIDSTDGVQQYVLSLGLELTRQNHEVHYLAGESKRSDLEHVHSLSRNLSVKFNKNRMSTPLPVSKTKITELLKRERFDVLHIQMPYSPFMGGKVIDVAYRLGIPVVGTFHILPASKLEALGVNLLGKIQRRSFRKLSHIVAVSEPAKICVERAFDCQATVVPNPVDLDVFQAKRQPKSKTPLRIVFVGRLVERKGCQELLRALAWLQQNDKLGDAIITICGDGPLKQELQLFSKTQGLRQNVTFAGRVSEAEKVRYLREATIAVFPSLSGESFGIVLIEAMAAGSDVVLAGDNPGYRYVMAQREQQLVQPHDTEAFAMQILHFMQHKNERQKISAWQQEHVKQFGVKVVLEKLLGIYAAAIAKNAKPTHNGGRS